MENIREDDGLHVVEDDDIRPPPHYRPGGAPQVVTADTARQGPAGGRVLWVLTASLLAIGIAWLGVTAWSGHWL